MSIQRNCTTVQAARAYMVHIPEPVEPVIVISSETETVTLDADLVHPITKKVYVRSTLELYSPVSLVQSGNPCWYFIISKNRCSCGQKDCAHIKKSNAA